ncbi:MAG: hypothetical protein KatS3mg028_0414 [Bacteroidia bacterium]|nr:MAG: hypothetical protein KatS3mg028_0414 [Bacteroidia bacterium]
MKKNTITLSVWILSILLFVACRKKTIKDYIDNSNTNPVFYINGTVNNQSLNISAGNDNYILLSNYQYNNNIKTYIFSGTFQKNNCTDCKNSLTIKIADDTIIPFGNTSHIQNLTPKIYHYAQDSTINFSYLNAYTNASFTGYTSYYLNENKISSNYYFINYFILPGDYQLKLKVYQPTIGCNDSLSNDLHINRFDDFYATFKYSQSSSSVTFTILCNNPSSTTFTINFGDGQTAVTSNTIITHTYDTSFQFSPLIVKLSAKSPKNKLCEFINIIQLSGLCSANYYYTIKSFWTTYSYYSKIIVEYTDENGHFYSSAYAEQPIDNYFEILEIADYQKNDKNQNTKKIKARLKVRVFDINDINIYKDISAETVFAVAYP